MAATETINVVTSPVFTEEHLHTDAIGSPAHSVVAVDVASVGVVFEAEPLGVDGPAAVVQVPAQATPEPVAAAAAVESAEEVGGVSPQAVVVGTAVGSKDGAEVGADGGGGAAATAAAPAALDSGVPSAAAEEQVALTPAAVSSVASVADAVAPGNAVGADGEAAEATASSSDAPASEQAAAVDAAAVAVDLLQ